MKKNVMPKAQVEETLKLRLIQGFLSLHDRSIVGVADAEIILLNGINLALEQWWKLPELSLQPRIPLLQQFQQLLEAQESAKIIVGISSGSIKLSESSVADVHGYAEVKDIIETWRVRVPNKWDNIVCLYDLLQWRIEMYNVVINAFKDRGRQIHQLGYCEKAWSVNTLAHIARKQGLHDSACSNIFPKGGLAGEFFVTSEDFWLEYAVSCFLQAIKFGVSDSRSHLARVLYLLSFDTADKPVGKVFDKYLDLIPYWVWLSWIPQLLLSLQRSEASHCKCVLLKIASAYPQSMLPAQKLFAVYHWLRAYILEQLDVCNRTVHERNVGLAKQRMHKNTSGPSTGSIGLADGDGRVLYHTERKSTSDNHQDPQGTLSVGSHHGRNSHEKEHERFTPTEGSTLARPAQMLQKISSAADQCSARHNSALVPAASATSVYDAAKDIMDALRSKHSNLAAEPKILLSEIGSRFVTLPEERLLADVYTLLHTVTSTRLPLQQRFLYF
ncbi:hypothetical protein IFM89_005748 [Coptis chinensis]|uniref:PIK-related kinase FAT domain-containing protein n=1 Tax=Coptis chinensis TaxID=261450 RepID=A0A835M9X4_9MAGN|nr:hypothetical protein IFM89_005748 [Coptis chinensis]